MIKKKIKIFFYTKGSISDKSLNGVNTAIRAYVEMIKNKFNYAPRIITTSSKKNYPYFKKINYGNFQVRRYKFLILSLPDLFFSIINADIIHLFNLWSLNNTFIGILCLILKKPYVITTFAACMPDRYQKNKFKKVLYNLLIQNFFVNKSNGLIVSSKIEEMHTKAIFPKSKIKIIENTCNELGSVKKRQSYKYKSEKIEIGYLGRFAREKNLISVIDWIEKLDEDINEKFNFTFTGAINSKYGEKFAKLVMNSSRNNIKITNPIFKAKEKIQWFNKIDLIILQSLSDAGALVIPEALSQGKLILCSNNCAMDNKNLDFIFINDNTYEGFKESLISIINERRNFSNLSKKAENHYKFKFSIKSIENKLIKYYQKIYKDIQ